ncbi:PREDICTED: adenosine receptor A2a-like [Branchiostoma belcheri]|uniref:Adenosine receptor A2a-like n=1 Tax=Branchiostoma belcheri TaxID=7741 RepID=A0A6P4ZR03_BRABE|nr:PREDICTED: adenosine receptor A2a-like [Branchiostoma belcheri]
MAVDLYYFVCHPLHYHEKVTTRRVVVGILAFRAFSFLGLTPVAFGARQVPTYSLHCEMTTVPGNSTLPDIFIGMNALFVLLVVLSVTVIYYLVFKEARRQQERDENRDLWVFQTRAFKVMLPHAIVLAASLTTALFHVAMVRMRALISEEQMSQRALIIADRTAILLLLTLSSLANPFIYSFRLPEFRRACRELCGLRTNPNPPVVPARRVRQDGAEMAAVTGPRRRGAPATQLASVQTSPAGLIMQPTVEELPSDPAEKQATQADTTVPGPASRAEHQTASGRLFRLTVRAEVHAKPTPRPEDNMTVTLPGQVHTDAETEDVPTLTLDTENNQATTGHTSDRPLVRAKLAWEG